MTGKVAANVDSPLHHHDSCTVGFSFVLSDSIPQIALLRKTFCGIAETLKVSKQDVADLETIIGELATNAVRHARGGTYCVYVDFTLHQATITVIDRGNGFTLDAIDVPGTERPDPLAAEDIRRVGGFGLPMVQMLADRVDIVANPPPAKGMSVRAIKQLMTASVSS